MISALKEASIGRIAKLSPARGLLEPKVMVRDITALSNTASSEPDMDQPIRLTTAGLAIHDRDDFVREFYGRIAQRIEIEPAPGDPYEIDVEAIVLPGMSVGGGSVSRMTGTRSTAMRADGGSDVVLTFSTAGLHITEPGGYEAAVRPGQALLTSLDRPFSMHMLEHRNEFLTVQVARDVLTPLSSDIDSRLTDVLAFDRSGLALLRGYAASISAAGVRTPELQALTARHLAELTALVIGPSCDGREAVRSGGLRAARLAQAKAVVLRHLTSSRLTATFVAVRLGVSTRYLHMLFETEPCSFSDFVTGQRLELASRILADPGQADRRILDIALALGFGDVTTFNRAFRRRFDRTPSQARGRPPA
jgi:AraC-like DNA-binding protein